MIIITNLNANRVNLAQNDIVGGLPAISSFLGLIGSVAEDLGFERWNVGVTPIIHEAMIADGRTKPEFIVKSGTFSPSENPEDLVGDVRFSMLVDLRDDGDTDARELLEALKGKRFSGGILWTENAQARDVAGDGSSFSSSPRGYALLPVENGPVSGGEEGGFMRVADAAFPAERTDRIIIPAAVGFRHIEKREEAPKRSGVRNPDLPHIFTCPLTGVAEAVNVRKRDLSEMSPEDLEQRMFRWHYDRAHAVVHPYYSV